MTIRMANQGQTISEPGFGTDINNTGHNSSNNNNSDNNRHSEQLHHQYHYHHRRRSRSGDDGRGSIRRRYTHIREMCQWNLMCSIVILFCCILIKSTGEAKKYQPLANTKLAEQFEGSQVVSDGAGVGSSNTDYNSHHVQHRK